MNEASEAEKARAALGVRGRAPRRDPSGIARAAAIVLGAVEHLDDDSDRAAVIALAAGLVDGALARVLPAGVPSRGGDFDDEEDE